MPKIHICQEASKVLKVAAAIEGIRPNVLLDDLILRHYGSIFQKELEAREAIRPKGPKDREAQKTERPEGLSESPYIKNPGSLQPSPREEKARKGARPWHGGPTPYEVDHPEIAARVLELWAGGAKKGGMGRKAVTKALQAEGVQITEAIVSQITIRARAKADRV